MGNGKDLANAKKKQKITVSEKMSTLEISKELCTDH